MTPTPRLQLLACISLMYLCPVQAQDKPLMHAQEPQIQKEQGALTSPVDESTLKQKVDDPGKGQPDRMRTDGVQGLGSGKEEPKKKTINEHPVNDKATIHTGRHAGTFGADRINNKNEGPVDLGHGTGHGMQYKGQGGDPAGKTDEQSAKASGAVDKRPLVKGNQWGGNTYSVSDSGLGSDTNDGIVGFLSYDRKGNLREEKVYRADGTCVTISYDAKGKLIDEKTTRPNPEADVTAGGVVVMPGTSVASLFKRGKKAGGTAGGADDGRNPDATQTGGTSEQAGKAVMMGKTGGQEAAQKEGGGTLNMNKVLEINTKINPVRQ